MSIFRTRSKWPARMRSFQATALTSRGTGPSAGAIASPGSCEKISQLCARWPPDANPGIPAGGHQRLPIWRKGNRIAGFHHRHSQDLGAGSECSTSRRCATGFPAFHAGRRQATAIGAEGEAHDPVAGHIDGGDRLEREIRGVEVPDLDHAPFAWVPSLAVAKRLTVPAHGKGAVNRAALHKRSQRHLRGFEAPEVRRIMRGRH